MTDSVVAEGQVKFREGKKWKTRWVVLRKPSPVADCLSLLVYKGRKKVKDKVCGHKEKRNVTLEEICGVEPGSGYDGVTYTLSVLCLSYTLVLGFHSRDALLAWDARVRYSLGEVHRFSVNLQPGTNMESGPASLHLCNNLLALSRSLPPVVIGHWKLSALRRYGAVPNGFVFEGGSRCGYWAGVFFLTCSEGEQISFLFDCIVRGVTPSRAPHGLRPALPADPGADSASAEERISLEASELEKRLSMLSQCSRGSSTASTYSCSTSVAGDDRSSMSSSSSNQSEASYGSRLPIWAEPTGRPHLSSETASSSSTLRGLAHSDDLLYAAVMGSSAVRPPSSHLHPRGLHDSGRQSSLDSGIGIATGSQSSYSGSCSSYTGSLDTTSQGGGEEFGSLASLPAPPPAAAPPAPSPLMTVYTLENRSATSPSCSSPSRCDSCASGRHSEEYQSPSLLRLHYDTPRSLLFLHPLAPMEPSAQGGSPEGSSSRDEGGGCGCEGGTRSPAETSAGRQAPMQRSHSSETPPSVDGEGTPAPGPPPLAHCSVCRDTQFVHSSDNYITPEQWRSAKDRCLKQVANVPSAETPDTRGKHYNDDEDYDDDGDSGLAGLRRAMSSPPPSSPPPPPPGLTPHQPASLAAGATAAAAAAAAALHSSHLLFIFSLSSGVSFQCAGEAPVSVPDTRAYRDSSANYVNVPSSLLRARANGVPLYSQLDLQEASVSAPREEDSIRYAHLDISAMETAQRVGAEHVQGREDRLTQLESRRRGGPPPTH
ncbi:protein Dok-7 [Genypterus blacodes]|uniref:protein Dok-7 n=1 Tax=Genypterus blacodes TaxID=154954 RepID=UPI003F765104